MTLQVFLCLKAHGYTGSFNSIVSGSPFESTTFDALLALSINRANFSSKLVSGTVVGFVPEETVWLPALIAKTLPNPAD
jgi:hypothetical protein